MWKIAKSAGLIGLGALLTAVLVVIQAGRVLGDPQVVQEGQWVIIKHPLGAFVATISCGVAIVAAITWSKRKSLSAAYWLKCGWFLFGVTGIAWVGTGERVGLGPGKFSWCSYSLLVPSHTIEIPAGSSFYSESDSFVTPGGQTLWIWRPSMMYEKPAESAFEAWRERHQYAVAFTPEYIRRAKLKELANEVLRLSKQGRRDPP